MEQLKDNLLTITFAHEISGESSIDLEEIANHLEQDSGQKVSRIKETVEGVKAEPITLAIVISLAGLGVNAASLVVNTLRFRQQETREKYRIRYKSGNIEKIFSDLEGPEAKRLYEMISRNNKNTEISIERYVG